MTLCLPDQALFYYFYISLAVFNVKFRSRYSYSDSPSLNWNIRQVAVPASYLDRLL